MHAFTIDEDAGFDYLVRVARDSNVPIEDVAGRINDLVSDPAPTGAGEGRPGMTSYPPGQPGPVASSTPEVGPVARCRTSGSEPSAITPSRLVARVTAT